MQTIWQSLIWREWHEHKWKLAALSAIMLSLQFVLIWAEPKFVTLVGPLSGLMAIAPLAVFVAMGTAAGERSEGTLAFVRGLPAERWRIAAAKTAAGAMVLLLPTLLATLLPMCWLAILGRARDKIDLSPLQGAGPFECLAISGLLAAGLAMSCFVWTLAFGIRKQTEIRAGLSGAGVLLAALALLVVRQEFRSISNPTFAMRLVNGINEVGPLGFSLIWDPLVSPWRVAASQLATCSLVLGWSIRRYGGERIVAKGSLTAARTVRGQSIASKRRAIRPAWRTTLAAIAWKQVREAAPFCFVGVVLFLLSVIGLRLLNVADDRFPEGLADAGVTVGMVVALLIGIGTFIGELQGRMLDFWRSRPIEPALWFWTKFVTGLAAAALLLAAPIACSGVYGVTVILVSLPWLAVVYSLAVCMTCCVRHAFYAGILSFTAASFLFVLSEGHKKWLDVVSYYVVLERARVLQFGEWLTGVYLPFLIAATSLAAAIAFAAWLAVKRDLGPHRISRAARTAHPSR
jgi:ABC-type transport system involved in multi-copper enzyme maturation permease subunit